MQRPRPDVHAAALPAEVVDAVHAAMEARGGVGAIAAMNLAKLVPDHAAKFMVTDRAGARAAVVIVSPETDTDAVERAVERARAAKLQLGHALGACVLMPWHVGRAGGLSFSIADYGQPLHSVWSRWRIGPSALRWLEAATRLTARPLPGEEAACRVAEPLRRLAQHRALSSRTRLAASRSPAALAAGEWQPREVLAHFDLWCGNILRAPHAGADASPFVIIDWAGSRTDGFAAYDLVRLARSLRLRPARLVGELGRHGQALGCPPAHMRHHLLVALSHLADHRGEWPVQAFADTAAACLDTLDRALR